MGLHIDVTAEGAKYLPFAQQKLAHMKYAMRVGGLGALTKNYILEDGARVHINSWGGVTDFIRITVPVLGELLMRTGLHAYALVKWDGSAATEFDSTGLPYDGAHIMACSGTTAVLRSSTSEEFYLVDATTFEQIGDSVTASVFGDASAGGGNRDFVVLQYQDAFAFIGNPQEYAPSSGDFQNVGTATQSLVPTTSLLSPYAMVWESDATWKSLVDGLNGALIYNSEGDASVARFYYFNPDTVPEERFFSSGQAISAAGGGGAICANSTQIIRAIYDPAIGGSSSIEITDHAGVLQSTMLVLPFVSVWGNLVCDDEQVVAICYGAHPTLGTGVVAKHYTLPDLVETDLTANYRSTFSSFGITFNNSGKVVAVNRAPVEA